MPANPYKEQRQAFAHLTKVFNKMPDTGVHKDLLICETLSGYAISKRSLQDFIESYIKAGVIREEKGFLYANKAKAQ